MYWFKCCRCTVSSIVFPVQSNNTTIYYYFCVKHVMLCKCLCSSSPSSSHFSAFIFFCSEFSNIGEFRAKKYVDYQTANTYHLFVRMNQKFFGSILFQNKPQQRGIRQGLLDKYSHLFICISLKQTLSSGQKSVYSVKILI